MKRTPCSADGGPPAAEGKLLIREMERKDLARAGQILYEAFSGGALQHGYTPRVNGVQEGTSWAWAIFRHQPRELLIAEIERRVVGVCCLSIRGDHGGVGPVAVDPLFHGQGIGRRMMDALLKRAEGLRSVRLFQEAFNPASFSLYYSYGFVPVADLMDLSVNPEERKKTDPHDNVSEVAVQDLDEVYMYDIPRSRLDRRPDLAYYRMWGKVFIYRDRSEIRGYLACLPGVRSVQLGPLVAEGEEEAKSLFQHALGVYGDRTSQTRVMAGDQVLVGYLKKFGFKLYCLNILMVRGSWRPRRHIEAFGGFPEGA